MLLGAPGRTTRNKKLLGAPGIATRSKDAIRFGFELDVKNLGYRRPTFTTVSGGYTPKDAFSCPPTVRWRRFQGIYCMSLTRSPIAPVAG